METSLEPDTHAVLQTQDDGNRAQPVSLTSRAASPSASQPVRHLCGVLALLVLVALFVPASRPTGWFHDFNAFYCAGVTIRARQDPYRAEPIGTCERLSKPAGFHVGLRHVSVPAPLPPYALALFVPLSAVPYGVAAFIWVLVLMLALAVTIEAMHRASGLHRATLFAVFAPIEGYSSLYLGETVPIAVASIGLAAMFLQQDCAKKAALAIAPALIVPHVGLPAALALFLWLPKARPPLAGIAAFLGAVSFACVSPRTVLEYLREVLPAHARSEAESSAQLSLTGLLHIFGVPTNLALHLGSASYIAALFLSLALCRMLAARDRRDGLIVTLPTALAVTGGVFMHVTQMPAALPAALFLFQRSHGVARRSVGGAIVLLALPWDQLYLGMIFIPLAAGAVFVMMRSLLRESRAATLLASLTAVSIIVAFDLALAHSAPLTAFNLPPVRPHDLAEVSWGFYVRAISTWGLHVFELARLPSWLAIATLAAALIRFVIELPKDDRRGIVEPIAFGHELASR